MHTCMQFACRGEEGAGMGATYSLMNRNFFFLFYFILFFFIFIIFGNVLKCRKIFVIVYHDGFDGRYGAFIL